MSTPTLTISASPHVQTPRTVSWTMSQVMIALVPAILCALIYFGIGSAIVIATASLSAVLAEYVIARFMLGREPRITDGSALLTGLLLGLNLPSNLPVWIVIIGSFVAIGIGKMAFGGLGCNIFNPALVGRVFLLISFPAQMTTWPEPLVNTWNYSDASTGATILSAIKEGAMDPGTVDLMSKALGNSGGSIGEVGGIALLLGFAYLLYKRIITWHIPVAIIATVGVFSGLIGQNIALEILSGGLLLGAIFMATDYVTSPMSHMGMIIYGVMIGVITVVIRQWGSYPEGMSFAILIMNGFVPLINRYCKPRKFGEGRVKK